MFVNSTITNDKRLNIFDFKNKYIENFDIPDLPQFEKI